MKQQLTGTLGLLLLLGSIWGLTPSVSKVAIGGGVQPFAYGFWLALLPGLLLVFVNRLRGKSMDFANPRRLLFYLVSGTLGVALPNLNFYLVIGHIPSGVMAVIITLATLFTYGLALLLKMERFDAKRGLGLLLGFLGIAVLLLPKSSLPDPEMAPWALLAVGTPLCYSLSAIVNSRFRPKDSDSLVLASGMLLGSMVLTAPLTLVLEGLYIPGPALAARDLAMGAHLFLTCFTYWLYFALLGLAGPVYVSQLGYVVTLTGIGWGWVFFGEQLSPLVWLAVALVFAGLALVNLRQRAAAKT